MELTQSTARLREVMGQTPSQQQDTILKPEIQKAFGTEQPSKAFDDIYEQQMKLDKDKEKDQTRSP